MEYGNMNINKLEMSSRYGINNGVHHALSGGRIKEVFDRLEKQDTLMNKQLFEVYYYTYTILHLLLQNYNIYRTELYAYNFTLFFFSAVTLSKRLFFNVWVRFKAKHPVDNFRTRNLLLSIFVVLGLNFVYCGGKSFYYYSVGSTLCLFYPYSSCLL
eukprot:TRINITY_DN2141_c0_g1_i23.p1 TRINITY_DN2141_c0_g1~~TRINITY_DN2141_c0_g1_i23.p1  ORF type:complete len:157 (-),score=28.40 TRINITY_DN2141_c0_g1_i23:64-534(-)